MSGSSVMATGVGMATVLANEIMSIKEKCDEERIILIELLIESNATLLQAVKSEDSRYNLNFGHGRFFLSYRSAAKPPTATLGSTLGRLVPAKTQFIPRRHGVRRIA